MTIIAAPKRFLLAGAVLLGLTQTGAGQSASNWRVFRMADGLPKPACVSVSVCSNGKVLAKLVDRSAAFELDGYRVKVLPMPEPLSSDIAESPGGQLWIIVKDGLAQWKNGVWESRPAPEIATRFSSGLTRSISAFAALHPIKQDRVRVLFPDQLLEFDMRDGAPLRAKTLVEGGRTRLGTFDGLTIARDGATWIAAEHGLGRMAPWSAVPKTDSDWTEYFLPEELGLHNLQMPREDSKGQIFAIADAQSGPGMAAVRFDGKSWTKVFAGAGEIRRVWSDLDQTVWIMTTDALFRRPAGAAEFVDDQEISARQFFDVATEASGRFWLATSDGLFRYSPPVWQSPFVGRQIHAPIQGFAEDATGRLWFISGDRLHSLRDGAELDFPWPTLAREPDAPRAIYPLKDGTLLLVSDKQTLRFNPESADYEPESARIHRAAAKPLGFMKDGLLCLQTRDDSGPTNKYRLELSDGSVLQPLEDPPSPEEYPDGFTTLFAAANGDLWLGLEKGGTVWFHDRKWIPFSAADGSVPDEVLRFIEFPNGKIGCATRSKVWEFDGRTWIPIRSNFDHVNALLCPRDGNLWVADDSGLYRFYQNAWIENGIPEGLPGGVVLDVFADQRGRVWAGTTRGISRYHPEADSDPPDTTVEAAVSGNGKIREGGLMTLLFSGQDKWKFTPPDRLLFSYRLDEREWSPFQSGDRVSFADLAAGEHYFQARAMDRNGNIDSKPALLEFSVLAPWYKDIRLVLIGFAGGGTALFFAGLAFNRHRRLVRSYAEVERKIAERTRELELAHRELLHSQKMNALGALAAGIAHDFNNILSIIKGSAQIIEDNLADPKKISTRVDRIKTVVEQGSGVVKAMLGFSRSSEWQPAVCAPSEVIADTVRLLGDRFLREIEVKLHPAPELPRVAASKDFIQQILLNFIFNAAEAVTDKKEMIIAAERIFKLPQGMVLAPQASPSGYVGIQVRDFGCGISPENLGRIFEPFFTTKAFSTRRGTGLGLSMAYELAKKIGAGIAVESAVNQGSCFTLILAAENGEPETKT